VAIWQLVLQLLQYVTLRCLLSPLLLLLLQEGLAHLCLVGSSTTLVRAKIEANLPRKRGPAVAGYDKAWDKFMDQVRLSSDHAPGLQQQQHG
jgi:protein pelota